MTRHFFITGLVRCKSAWLSNLLTWGPTFCWHDVFYGIHNDAEFARKMDVHEFAPVFVNAIGVADPALVHCWKGLVREYPEAKWIVVQRDFEDAFRSALHTFEAPNKDLLRNGLMSASKDLAELCAAVKPKYIKFDELSDVAKCYELAAHLGVMIGPAQRVQQLCEMNVQIHPPVLKRRLESLKSQLVVDSKEAA